MAFAGFLSSFAKPLWGMISPIVKQAGRGLASMFVSKGAQKMTQFMGDKGITIEDRAISNINNNMNRARQIRQRQLSISTPQKKVTFIQQQPAEQQVQQEQEVQQIPKRKFIKKATIPTANKSNNRYLRKR